MKYKLIKATVETVEAGKRNTGSRYIKATFMNKACDPLLGNLSMPKNIAFYAPSKDLEADFIAAWEKEIQKLTYEVNADTFSVPVEEHFKKYTRDDDQGHKKGTIIKDENGKKMLFTTIQIFSITDEDDKPLIDVAKAAARIMKSTCITLEQFKQQLEAKNKAEEAAAASKINLIGNPEEDLEY